MSIMGEKIIETWFPIRSVGSEGSKEKTKAIGRIPSIHQYHARRPTCAARAIILASILNNPKKREDYIDLWNLVRIYGMRELPDEILFQGKKMSPFQAVQKALTDQGIIINEIKGFDPFAGGGTFPLEMKYIGMTTIASDLNPVAVLINKATCEFPQKYGQKLIDLLKIYFQKVQDQLIKEVSLWYKNDASPDNEINFYFWTREVPCPECNLWIPMVKSFDLSRKYGWALVPSIPIRSVGNQINFTIGSLHNNTPYYTNGSLTCPRCGNTLISKKRKGVEKKTLKDIVASQARHRIIAVYENIQEKSSTAEGRFRPPTEIELQKGNVDWVEVRKQLITEYPDLDIPFAQKVLGLWMIQGYGINSLLKCFNGRQLNLLKKLVEIIKEIEQDIKSKYEPELAQAILTYLAFGVLRISDFNSTLTQLKSPKNPGIGNTWTRPGIFMTGTYIEVNPLRTTTTGGWMLYFDSLERILLKLVKRANLQRNIKCEIKQMDAMEVDYPNDYFDYCFTDPPYYNNIPYAADSDFFYAWYKVMLSRFYPELFLQSATPKDTELIADDFRHDGAENAKKFYEEGMGRSFKQIHRVLKQNGMAIIVFAHKELQAWQRLLRAIIDSDLVITNTWPLLMESRSPMRTQNLASLDSVVILVCKKIPRSDSVYYDESFKQKVEVDIKKKLERQWNLGFRGADFFLSALGPAFEIFSRYKAVLDVRTDKPMELAEYMDFIDRVLVRFSLGDFSSLDAPSQLYLTWRNSYKSALLTYDVLWKFTRALDLELKDIEGAIVTRKIVNKKVLYDCPDAIAKVERFKIKNFSPNSLIEALQHLGVLWNESSPMLDSVAQNYTQKYGPDLWRVAQALHDLNTDAPESKLFAGILRKFGYSVRTSKKSKPSSVSKEHYKPTALDQFFDFATLSTIDTAEIIPKNKSCDVPTADESDEIETDTDTETEEGE